MNDFDGPDDGSAYFGSGFDSIVGNNETYLLPPGAADLVDAEQLSVLKQLHRFRLSNDDDTIGNDSITPSAAATADGIAPRLPHNLTLIFNELQRFSFRSEASLQPYRTHGMTDEEYSRFVSDMWITFVLTMLMVFIVLALCLWFLYYKFKQWKRQCEHTDSR